MLLQNNIPFTSNRQRRTLLVIQSQVCSDLFSETVKIPTFENEAAKRRFVFWRFFVAEAEVCGVCVKTNGETVDF